MMEKRPVEIKQPNLLVVEGVDDQGVLGALLKHMGIADMQVVPTGGKTLLVDSLHGLKIVTGFASVRSMGVVRDADVDAGAAFQSVCHALSREGLPVPGAPLLPEAGPPRVTVMILPGASRPGALEDLCLEAVAGDPAFPCLGRYFECLKEVGAEGPKNLSRAQMQVFLASRTEAGKRLGEAAQAGYLDQSWSSPAFDELRRFLQVVTG